MFAVGVASQCEWDMLPLRRLARSRLRAVAFLLTGAVMLARRVRRPLAFGPSSLLVAGRREWDVLLLRRRRLVLGRLRPQSFLGLNLGRGLEAANLLIAAHRTSGSFRSDGAVNRIGLHWDDDQLSSGMARTCSGDSVLAHSYRGRGGPGYILS